MYLIDESCILSARVVCVYENKFQMRNGISLIHTFHWNCRLTKKYPHSIEGFFVGTVLFLHGFTWIRVLSVLNADGAVRQNVNFQMLHINIIVQKVVEKMWCPKIEAIN